MLAAKVIFLIIVSTETMDFKYKVEVMYYSK